MRCKATLNNAIEKMGKKIKLIISYCKVLKMLYVAYCKLKHKLRLKQATNTKNHQPKTNKPKTKNSIKKKRKNHHQKP